MERIAVYGAGTIGSCQATLIIGNGLPCTVIGHSERGLERCRKSIEQNWDDLIAEGLATEGNKQAAMALVTITNDPAALQEHTFVFEAVAEGTEEKRAVYETIEQNAAPNVVIASCTSSIDAEILAGLVSHPERLLIAHPFQPVHSCRWRYNNRFRRSFRPCSATLRRFSARWEMFVSLSIYIS